MCATSLSWLRSWRCILIHHKDKVRARRMQHCIQPLPANPLEPWPHINTLKLSRASGNHSVYSTCHPSFGKTCLFLLSSVERLNKHCLAYATYYCFPEFVTTNHPQIRPQMWAGCLVFWGWLMMTWCGRVAQVNRCPFPSGHEVRSLEELLVSAHITTAQLVDAVWQEAVLCVHWRWAAQEIWDAGYFHEECTISCVKRSKFNKSNPGVSCACLTCISDNYPVIYNQSASVHLGKNRNLIFPRT